MNFASVKKLTILEGNVVKILANGVCLWKLVSAVQYETVDSIEQMTDTSKQYVLSTTGTLWAYGEVTEEKEAENKFVPSTAALNQRHGTSSVSAKNGYFVTDYIKVDKFAEVSPYIMRAFQSEGVGWKGNVTDNLCRVHFFDANKTRLGNIYILMAGAATAISKDYFDSDGNAYWHIDEAYTEEGEENSVSVGKITAFDTTKVAYVRVTLAMNSTSTAIAVDDIKNVIITFDADAKTVTETKWHDTGAKPEAGSDKPDTTLVWQLGVKIDSSTGAETSGSTTYSCTDYIEVVDGYTYTINKHCTTDGNIKVVCYDENKSFLACSSDVIPQTTELASAVLPIGHGVKYFKIRCYHTVALHKDGDYTLTAKKGANNIISIAGYEDGKRLNSSGTTTDLTGFVSTGMIDISACTAPVTIRTKGVNFNYNGYCYFVIYNASGTKLGYTTLPTMVSNGTAWNNYAVTADADGNIVITKHKGAADYFRISGYGSGANLIVTVNEEIG